MPRLNPAVVAAAGLAGAGLAAAAGLHKIAHRLPTTTGRRRIGGIQATVEIIRDKWGIPYIYAQTDEDLFFAQGFVHAQDRYLQMELQRRAGSGRLSEIAGQSTLDADRFMRRLGLARIAQNEVQRLSEEGRRYVDAYARGINAYLDLQPLPWELLMLTRKAPEKWTAVDCLVFARVMAWNLTENLGCELTRAKIVELKGEQALSALDSNYSENHPLTVPPGAPAGPAVDTLLNQLKQAGSWLNGTAGGASNGWAVSGTRTASGRPLLANDPHLLMQVPGIWYENALESPNFHVVGASLPGLPGVMIGHNERIAWGITAAMVDNTDAFVEEIDTECKRYRTPNGWRDLIVVEEEIEVKGRKEPHIEHVAYTRHGPLMTERDSRGHAIAVQSSVLRSESSTDAFFELIRAGSWDEFRAALKGWLAPCLNFVYADVEGNIGYQLAGSVPKRPAGTGVMPLGGWSDKAQWDGFLPFDDLPHALNPENNAVVTANNRIAPPNYEPLIHGEWIDGFRAQRIWDILGDRDDFTVPDFRKAQGDVYSIPGKELQGLVKDLKPTDQIEKLAFAFFLEWDGLLTETTVGGTVYEAFWLELVQRVVQMKLGDAADLFFGGSQTGLLNGTSLTYRYSSRLLQIVRERDPDWFGGNADGWDKFLAECFTAAIQKLRERAGDEVIQWQWGKLHRLTFRHLLSRVPKLDKVFNKGPVPMPGDMNTVLQAGFTSRRPFDVASWTVSYRQVIDVGDWSNCWSIMPPGQSGHRFSKHYADAIKPWKELEFHPMIFDRQTAIENAEGALRFEPPGVFS